MTTALLLQLLVSLNSVDPTAAVELPSMAVMPIRSATLPETTVTVLDDALLAAVADLNAFKLVGQADIRAVLGLEETRQQLGCTDEGCIAELAGALGTRYIFSTTGDILGDSVLITASIFDQTETRSVARHRIRTNNDPSTFLDAIDELVEGLQDKLVAADPTFASRLSKLLNTYYRHHITPVFGFRSMVPRIKSCKVQSSGEDCLPEVSVRGGDLITYTMQYKYQIHPRLSFRIKTGPSTISSDDINSDLSTKRMKGWFASFGSEVYYPIHHSRSQMPGASKQTVSLIAGFDVEKNFTFEELDAPSNGPQINFFAGMRAWWLFMEVGGGVRFPSQNDMVGYLTSGEAYDAYVAGTAGFWSVNVGMSWGFDSLSF